MQCVSATAAAARHLILLLCLASVPVMAAAEDVQGAAELIELRGDVKIARQGGEWISAAPGEVHILQAGDAIRTGKDGWAALLTRDEGRIHIHRYTLFVIRAVAPSAGWLRTRVAQVKRSLYELVGWRDGETAQAFFVTNNPDADISVRTPTVELGVRGTAFQVQVVAHELSVLQVLEGLVLATSARDPADAVRAPAGTEVVAREGERLEMSRLLVSPEDAVQWTLFVPPLLQDQELAYLEKSKPPLARSVRSAYTAMQRGEIVEARAALASSIHAYPGYATPWHLLALAELVLGDRAAALDAAKAGTDADPDSVTAWIMLSNAEQAVHDLRGAILATQRALDIDPGNVVALTNLARLQFGSENDTSAAWRTLQRAQLALDRVRPSGAGAAGRHATQAAEIANLRGYLLLAQQDTRAAVRAFETAIRLNGRLGEPHLGLGIARMRDGRVAEAMKAMATAVLLEPRRSLFYSYWGKMQHQIGRYDKALDMLDHAKRLDPSDPTPLLYEALVLRDLYRTGEAIQRMQAAIELNDNRGVFRSRFLLDQDLAVKNVDLAVLFNELGLSAWAQQKATAAIAQDYSNYSAHNMLQGSLGRQGLVYAQSSEALLARMLAPASVNSFNSYNQYTPLFEQPEVAGTISAGGGNWDRVEGGVLVHGAVPARNLAFGASVGYSDDDGWRDTNGERWVDRVAVAKWDPSAKDSFLLTASQNSFRRDDAFYPRYEYDFPASPEDRHEADLTRLELGYRHSFRPRTHLLLFVSRLDLDIDRHVYDLLLDDPIATVEQVVDSRIERPYTQAQAQLMFPWDTAGWGRHQFILGTAHYWLDQTLNRLIETSVDFGEMVVSVPQLSSSLQSEVEPRLQSYYVLDTWTLSTRLSLGVGLYLDHFRDGNLERGTQWAVEKLNPRLGAVWMPSQSDTLRVAAFRYLLPAVSARLDPTLVAGVPILRDEREGALESGLHMVWEREWKNGFFATDLFARETEVLNDVGGRDDPVELESLWARRKGVALTLNQLIGQRLGLAARYRYLDTTDRTSSATRRFPATGADRRDHLVSASLNYLSPSGLFGSLGLTYRNIWSSDEERPREDLFIADLDLGYRFPHRRAEIALRARNLFDETFNWVTDRFDVFTGREPGREILATLSVNF